MIDIANAKPFTDLALTARLTEIGASFGEPGVKAALAMIPFITGCAACGVKPNLFDATPWAIASDEHRQEGVNFTCICPKCLAIANETN